MYYNIKGFQISYLLPQERILFFQLLRQVLSFQPFFHTSLFHPRIKSRQSCCPNVGLEERREILPYAQVNERARNPADLRLWAP